MADRWTLRTPTGDVQLNATFSAPKYQAGGVDRGAALRRDGRGTFQRSGDGLATPGPLRLIGRVWNDAQDIGQMLDELDSIREAVAACIEVVRATGAGTFVYGQLAGGPPPAITPDGLGGFQVEIELWPGRAEPTYVPLATDFSDYATGAGAPEGWTNRWDACTYAIAESGGAIGGKHLTTSTSSSSPILLSWDDVPADADLEAVTVVAAAFNNSTNAASVILRGSGTAAEPTGYLFSLGISGTSDGVGIYRVTGGTTPAVIATAAFTWSANTRYVIRAKAIGNALKMKAWAYGDPEPSSWSIETTDANIAAGGWVGVGRRYRFSQPTFDYFSVGLDGASAPLPA